MDKTADKWIKLAEYDLQSAKDLLKTDSPITNSVCFHTQQCVEKISPF